MSDKELICGCGFDIKIIDVSNDYECWMGHCTNDKCPLSAEGQVYFKTEAEAIAAFRLATRAGVKQGMKPETVKYLQYLASGDTDITDNSGDWERQEVAKRVLELEEINLPE